MSCWHIMTEQFAKFINIDSSRVSCKTIRRRPANRNDLHFNNDANSFLLVFFRFLSFSLQFDDDEPFSSSSSSNSRWSNRQFSWEIFSLRAADFIIRRYDFGRRGRRINKNCVLLFAISFSFRRRRKRERSKLNLKIYLHKRHAQLPIYQTK